MIGIIATLIEKIVSTVKTIMMTRKILAWEISMTYSVGRNLHNRQPWILRPSTECPI